MMKTAIPTHNDQIAADGVSATSYTIVEGDNEAPVTSTLTVDSALSVAAFFGALKARGVERILAGNLEPEYLSAAEMGGFQVFYGASGSVSDALNLISMGILDSMANGCGCSGGCSGGGCGGSSDTSEDSKSTGCGSGCGCGSK
jgi:predicted Fe-Mo cluster-binding NifX family protein